MKASGPGRVDWERVESELVPHLEPFASREIDKWTRGRPDAVSPMQRSSTERIYEILPADVLPFLHPPMDEWPFPRGTRKSDWMVPEIENMTGGLPLAMGFHNYVEQFGRIPTWSQARQWFSDSSQSSIFHDPAWEKYRANRSNIPEERWERGICWRIGNAYLSFIREMDFLSRMVHVHGIPLRMHILADAVLKVDFWCGPHAVCVFIPNDMKRRKKTPVAGINGVVHEVMIGDGTAWVEENGLRRRLAWNEIKQAPEAELAKLASAIRADRTGVRGSPQQRSRPPSIPGFRIPGKNVATRLMQSVS